MKRPLQNQAGQVWPVSRLPWPVEWDRFFGREGALLLEIGFGNGQFLLDLARRRPEANVVGVEISNPSLRRAADKARKQQLPDLCLVYGDAALFLQANCRQAALSEVYVNFPDPWPKAAHQHRRLISDRFLQLLATRLRPGGRLDVATDHAGYQAWIAHCLGRTPYFDSRHEQPFVTGDRQRLQTKYERQALDAGRRCLYFQYRRNQNPAAALFPIPQELAMPHAIVYLPLTLPEIQARFVPGSAAAGEVTVRQIALFAGSGRPSLLVECYVNEAPMPQRVALALEPRQGSRWKVSLYELGFPRPTAGIHLAVAQVAVWLASLHPDGAIVQHNLAAQALSAALSPPTGGPK